MEEVVMKKLNLSEFIRERLKEDPNTRASQVVSLLDMLGVSYRTKSVENMLYIERKKFKDSNNLIVAEPATPKVTTILKREGKTVPGPQGDMKALDSKKQLETLVDTILEAYRADKLPTPLEINQAIIKLQGDSEYCEADIRECCLKRDPNFFDAHKNYLAIRVLKRKLSNEVKVMDKEGYTVGLAAVMAGLIGPNYMTSSYAVIETLNDMGITVTKEAGNYLPEYFRHLVIVKARECEGHVDLDVILKTLNRRAVRFSKENVVNYLNFKNIPFYDSEEFVDGNPKVVLSVSIGGFTKEYPMVVEKERISELNEWVGQLITDFNKK
jgi:hypothetical protein